MSLSAKCSKNSSRPIGIGSTMLRNTTAGLGSLGPLGAETEEVAALPVLVEGGFAVDAVP
jgi:hypothetical protein